CATWLVTTPNAFVATTRNNAPLSETFTDGNATCDLLNGVAAPGMLVNVTPSPTSRCHVTQRGGAPVTDTENVTDATSYTTWLTGLVSMPTGAVKEIGATPLCSAN